MKIFHRVREYRRIKLEMIRTLKKKITLLKKTSNIHGFLSRQDKKKKNKLGQQKLSKVKHKEEKK